MTPTVEYCGWILAPDEDAQELESLGVHLGERVNGGWDNCRVSSAALDAMDARWGRWTWGLKPVAHPSKGAQTQVFRLQERGTG